MGFMNVQLCTRFVSTQADYCWPNLYFGTKIQGTAQSIQNLELGSSDCNTSIQVTTLLLSSHSRGMSLESSPNRSSLDGGSTIYNLCRAPVTQQCSTVADSSTAALSSAYAACFN